VRRRRVVLACYPATPRPYRPPSFQRHPHPLCPHRRGSTRCAPIELQRSPWTRLACVAHHTDTVVSRSHTIPGTMVSRPAPAMINVPSAPPPQLWTPLTSAPGPLPSALIDLPHSLAGTPSASPSSTHDQDLHQVAVRGSGLPTPPATQLAFLSTLPTRASLPTAALLVPLELPPHDARRVPQVIRAD
jgi:hypothetical protein